MNWLRSEDLTEVKVVTAPLLSIAVRRRFARSKLTSKLPGTREIIGIWVKEKQRSNQPRPPSPKSLRKWRSRE
jgi:hypothetical protein